MVDDSLETRRDEVVRAKTVRLAVAALAIALACAGACSASQEGGDAGSDAAIDATTGDAELDAAPQDASTKDVATTDWASIDFDAGCTATKPFGAPIRIVELSADELISAYPHLTPDELTMYLSTSVHTGDASPGDIVVVTRPSRAAPFGAPTLVANVSSPQADIEPMISADGLTLVFVRQTQNGGIMVATRPSTSADFGAPAYVQGIPSNGFDPFLTTTGELWFMKSGASYDLFHGVLADGGVSSWDAATEVNTAGEERVPVLSADMLTIFFARDGDGGQIDIWTGTRDAATSPFTGIHPVAELAAPGINLPGWLSVDGCRFYYFSAGFYYIAVKPK